jgi:hypothetical protein
MNLIRQERDGDRLQEKINRDSCVAMATDVGRGRKAPHIVRAPGSDKVRTPYCCSLTLPHSAKFQLSFYPQSSAP